MAAGSSGPGAPPGRPVFSPDGFWWWDGTQWRPAVSPDGMWRWNGQAWEPNRSAGMAPAPVLGGGGTATAVVITVLAFVGVLVVVSLIVIAILYTMGSQISNVFSNVAAALGATPSP
jgi:Flp pilus assembly pilin Flp